MTVHHTNNTFSDLTQNFVTFIHDSTRQNHFKLSTGQQIVYRTDFFITCIERYRYVQQICVQLYSIHLTLNAIKYDIQTRQKAIKIKIDYNSSFIISTNHGQYTKTNTLLHIIRKIQHNMKPNTYHLLLPIFHIGK